jgi:hypothetical protein
MIHHLNRPLQGDLRDRLYSVQEISTLAMDEPDDRMSLAIFNAEVTLPKNHQQEVTRISHRIQRLAQTRTRDDQQAYPLLFWMDLVAVAW